MLDGIGQACIIIYYAFLFAKSSETIVLLQLFAISLAAWQFVNGLLSYKFFEGQSKKHYVRVCGMTWIASFALIGILYFLGNFLLLVGLSAFADSIKILFDWIVAALWFALPIVLGVFACWYLYITIKDINIVMNKTI